MKTQENSRTEVTGTKEVFSESKMIYCGEEELFERIRDDVYCRLINFENSGEEIDEMPYDRFLDLAIVYYYRLDLGQDEYAAIMIRKQQLLEVKENRETLRKAAWDNMISKDPVVIRPLFEMLEDMGAKVEENAEVPVLVVTNSSGCYGAIAILYPGVAKEIREKLGCDYFILPSSIHECLVIPSAAVDDVKKLMEMVYTINRSELEAKDILSDSVYYYSEKDGLISLGNERKKSGSQCKRKAALK